MSKLWQIYLCKKDWKVGGESVGEHAYFTRFVRDNVNKERTLKGQADREG